MTDEHQLGGGSPWLSDSANPRAVQRAATMWSDGRDEGVIRTELAAQGVVGEQQDAVMQNLHREAGKKQAAFDKETRGQKTRAQVILGFGMLMLLVVVVGLVLGRLFWVLLPVGLIVLVVGVVQYVQASRRVYRR